MNKNGLLHASILDGSGGKKDIGWKEVNTFSGKEGTLWMHLNADEETVKEWISEKSGLDDITAEALLNTDSRPRLVVKNSSVMLISLRAVNFNPESDPEDMVYIHVFIDKNRIISMRQQRVMAVEDIYTDLENNSGPENASAFLVSLLTYMTERTGTVIRDTEESVDTLEEQLLGDDLRELRALLSETRRQIILLRKYIQPQKYVINKLSFEKISWLDDLDRQYIKEIAEHTTRFVEDLDAGRDRATIVQEEVTNLFSEKMNKTIYALSIVATIFLPLGLITGLLGINVAGIPGAENKSAFYIVCGILVVLAVIEYFIFRLYRKI